MSMRIRAMIVAVFISVFAIPASAQVLFRQRALLRGTTVVFFNATEDQRPLKLILDDTEVDGVLKPGKYWSDRFGGGIFIIYANNQQIRLAVSAKGCDIDPTRLVLAPPVWASDATLLGTLTLTPEYLNSGLSEPQLKNRVEEIEKFLKNQLGGKRMKNELRDWFKAAKKIGLAFQGFDCDGPDIEGVRVEFNVDSYNENHKAIAVYIRGSREDGYRMEPPRWIAW